jgi:nucleoid-associated protein YgaU
MPPTNNHPPENSQEKKLYAEKSADIIQQLILQKRIAEANLLFQESASDMENDYRERISKQLSALLEQAEKYFSEADTLETERKLEQAREKYKRVEDIAIDYPELPEALRRINDAIALIQALEHRAERRTNRQEKQSALLITPSHSEQHRGWLALLACFLLILTMIGAGLFYTHNRNATLAAKKVVQQVVPLEKDDLNTVKNTVSPATKERIEQRDTKSQREKEDKTAALKQQTQKNVLPKEEPPKQQGTLNLAEQIASSEIKKVLPPAPEKQTFKSVPAPIEEDRQQKLSDQGTELTREEKAVSFTEPQLNRKDSLFPVPVSSLQMEKKIGETNGDEGEFSIRQDIQPTADTARKSEKTMGETSTSQLQDHVTNRLTVDDPEQPQQTRPVIIQRDESPVETSSNGEDSTESVYTVQPGDTLGLISLKVYGASSKWPAIANANKEHLSQNSDKLRAGMILIIPAFSETGNVSSSQDSSTSLPVLNKDGTYTVQSGDSLGIIAHKLFGNAREWKKIYELNNDELTAPHKLKVGQILRVKDSVPVKKTIKPTEPEENRPAVLNIGLEEDPSDDINSH